MTSEPIRLGVVGCGGYGRSLARACSQTPRIQLVACYDVSRRSAESFAAEFGCRAMDSEEALLSDPEIRGVIIVSPNDVHRANAVAAAEAGKHVFVDKPIAGSAADGIAIVEACKRAGIVLAVGHNGRRLAGHRKMKEMIEAGAVGTVITGEANFSHSGGLGLTNAHWRAARDRCPALPLMQLGVHFADTLQYLLGDVTEVSSFMEHLATPVDNDDATVSILRFASRALGYLGSNYATPAVYYVNVYGTGGNLICHGGGQVIYHKAGEKQPETIRPQGPDSQVEELEEFADCILTGGKPEVSGEEGLKALAIVVAALRSSQENRPVTIAEILAG